MKKSLKIIIIVIAILAVLFIGKNIFVKAAIQTGTKAATGLTLKMDKFDLGLFSTRIGIEGLSLMNPKGFPDEAMFHAPEIFVNYRLGSFLTGKMHIEDIRLDFDRFVIIKNKEGQTNIDVLKPKDEPSKKKEAAEKPTAKKIKKGKEIQIDHLMVKVGKVIFKDYSGGGEPSVKEVNINLSQELNDVSNKNLNWLLGGIATKAIMKSGLSSITGFSTDMMKGAMDAPSKAVDTLKGTADTLKDKIKLPFGNK